MSGNIVISISTTLSSERQLSDAQFCPKTAGMKREAGAKYKMILFLIRIRLN
jgi:hypothetical protein